MKAADADLQEPAARYIAFCENMTPGSLGRLAEFCAPDIHFRDPFNDVTGIDNYRRVLAKMFEDVGQPTFLVTGKAQEGSDCYLRWRFTFRRAGGEKKTIQGMSEIRFTADGLVREHIDFWDAGQVYEMIPLLRGLVGLVKRRLSVR